MDEGTLNDLLECSVCLERLDTSSKVLPCQHTFCRKCLEDIVNKHKELRCPECRILVHAKVDELPPNVLLMRILEGMRNAAPKKPRGSNKAPNQVHQLLQQQHHHHTNDNRSAINKQVHMAPHQQYAKALYDYAGKETGDLSFKRGDIIVVRKKIDNNWYQGECAGKQGVFPISYVQNITPIPSHIPQCKALYQFKMNNDEEEGCLIFNKGDIINVIRRVDENWAEGKLDGKIGIFPLAFVEMNSLARSLMKLSSNAQPGPSRLAPPTPTTEDSTPLIPTDHSRTIVNSHPNQQSNVTQSIVVSDSSSTGSSSTTTPNISSSNTSSSSSTAPSSPASPPTHNQTRSAKPDLLLNTNKNGTPQRSPNTGGSSSSHHHHHHHNKEKRHSFTSLQPANHNQTTHRHSAEIVVDTVSNTDVRTSKRGAHTSDWQLPAAYIALYPYKPQKADELELRKGGIYMVTERCQDGWYKGTSNRTQKCGVFPGNYVTLARGAHHAQSSSGASKDGSSDTKSSTVSYSRSGKSLSPSTTASSRPPELPPRSISPAVAAANNTPNNTISSSWHGQQDNASVPLGRSSSAIMPQTNRTQHLTLANNIVKSAEKTKDRKEKGTVSLMRRLTSIKRSKSPPPSSYSMDNPVFEDSTVNVTASPSHPVHVRSGSCPSQLLQVQPIEHHRLFGSTSQRLKHKERPSVLTYNSPRTTENATASTESSPDVHRHKKSNSLDAGNRSQNKTNVQTVRERFRCIAPYPPNSEYELELQVNDIIYVHKKRDDGWYKGTQQRTGRTGLFPASFVESF